MLCTLSTTEIREVFGRNRLGRLGYASGADLFIVPINYVYAGEDDSILCHSYEGQKIEDMRANGHVCFQVEEILDNRNWKCVMAQGTYDELTGSEEIAAAEKLLSGEALQAKAGLTALPPTEVSDSIYNRPRISVFYRIRLYGLSGRFERAGEGSR